MGERSDTVTQVIYRVVAHLENVEKSGNLRVVREKPGKKGKVRENVFLHA